ncbi:MAG TPA: FimV/HubP family polar landmark protein [Pseudomonadales bacterium]
MLRYLLCRHASAGRRGAARCAHVPPNAVRALVLAALLGPASAWALGLGDIRLESSLNEKLNAEIELLDARGLQPTEIIVSLASAEDFERVGVERFFFLTDLRFEVAYDERGVRSVRVTSTQPVTEPYLNFLVEVLWPSGRLLKEYTLLLDPPTYSPAPAPSVAAPARTQQADTAAGRIDRSGSATVTRGTTVQLSPGAARQPSPLDEGIVDGEYRMTDRTDTLWSIAQRALPSDKVTVQQNMLAIQRLNPEAFLHDNINLLKAGYTLRLPTEQQALSLGSAEANNLVAMQNEDWRALRRGEPRPERSEQLAAAGEQAQPALQAQVDATPAANRAPAPRESERDGELRIVAGAGDGAVGISPVGGEELNAVLEERDRLGREVEALTEALDRERELASDQVAVKERQLEVKDQQIAEMQAEMQRLREELDRLRTAAEQSQNQSASAAGAWWQSPYVLGGAAAVLVLLLAYGLIAARRRRVDDDDAFFADTSVDTRVAPERAPVAARPGAAAAGAAAAAVTAAPTVDQDTRADTAATASPAASTRAAPSEAAETDSETSDVIGEADIYIAYGRYPQAIGLLLGVLEDDPNRNDVRLKLLELYAETRDREAFDTHLAELMRRCEDEEALLTARELGAQFGDDVAPAADHLLADTVALDDLEAAPADDALVLDGLDAPAPGSATAGATGDFELELDGIGDEAAGAQAAGRSGEALGGDLGIDFDPDREQNGSSVHSGDGGHDSAGLGSADDLDLDLDLDDPDVLGDDAFDFADEGDTAGTKLDLARAYIDMGDQDGARDILNEVVAEGTPEQKKRAQAMLEEL